MIDRVTSLKGIHNFRDYGGYRARGGATLRTGLLYRSSQHKDATAEDLAHVASINFATIIDLRGDSERRDFPCARPDDFGAEIVFAAGETMGHAPHVEAARSVRTPEESKASLGRGYAEMPFRPVLVQSFRCYFEALATRDGPSLVHCLAGKDRTGIAVALLHDLLGVHWDDIMADYLLTNVAGNIDARVAAGAEVVRQNFGPEMTDDAVRMLMSVQPEWLDTAFDAMRREHGSVQAYARDVLQVTPEQVSALEARFLG
jgi:protein-tyrosine phosphatase